jgi:hypothetical protein
MMNSAYAKNNGDGLLYSILCQWVETVHWIAVLIGPIYKLLSFDSYAPINVNPEGGGRAKGGDLINQVVPWVGIWTDTFF